MPKRLRISLFAAALLALAPVAAFATGSLFDKTTTPGPDDDIGPSMGVFRILVDPQWRPWYNANLAAGPFWDPATGKLTSPVLYDNTTTIGRSAAHTQGSAADVGGTPVGTAATPVKDADMIFPPGFNVPNPLRNEVHTEVRSLTLVTGTGCGLTQQCSGLAIPLSVTGGSGNGLPVCPGEVESNSNDGFPAKSFFDVFVEVDLGSGSGAFGVVRNLPSNPLLVAHDPIGTFPPQVIYIHENPAAVPVYFKTSGSTVIPPILSWNAGQRFGYLVLAGHGENLSCADSAMNCAQFWNAVTSMPEMPCSQVPGSGEWSLLALVMALVLVGVWAVARRRGSAIA